MKKRWLLLMIVTLLFSCTPNPVEKSQEVVIGVYGSMTGTTATFGQSSRKGVELATAELNARGGLLGKKIRLVIEDDQSKPEEAQTVATKLVSKDRVVAMIGETASSRSLAAAPVCQQARVPMISPSSTNPKVTQVGDYIFRVCFIDPFQGQAMAKFAAETLKLKKVAILRDIKNEYSVGLADVFIDHFKKQGGEIVGDQSYGEGDTDFNAQLTSIKANAPEAIFVPGYYTEVGLIARQARKLGITVPLLGGDGWESPKLWEIGGEALNGCFYTNHYSLNDPNPAIQSFVKAYRSQFQETPDAVGALSYDAMRILAAAIVRAGTTEGPRIREALAITKGFAGVTGNITLDADRNAVKPAVVLRINNGKLEFEQRVNP